MVLSNLFQLYPAPPPVLVMMTATTASPLPFQQLLEQFVEDGVAPGLQGVVFDRHGIVFDGAAGVRALANREEKQPEKPMTTNTIGWIASCSKVPISIVLLRLLERGAGNQYGLTLETLDDHDALTNILPEFKHDSGHDVTKILVGFSDEVDSDGKRKTVLQPAKDKVTLRHLMTHSAGIAYDFAHEQLSQYFNPTDGTKPNSQQTSATGRIADFDVPKVCEAGQVYTYGHATDWLGQVIVRLAGVNLRQAMIEQLFDPLGIPTSQIDMMLRHLITERQNEDVSHFFVRDQSIDAPFREVPVPLYEPEQDDPPAGYAHYASAGLRSSSSTYARILQAVLSHDERLLQQSTWQLAEADNTTQYGVQMPYPILMSYNSTLSCNLGHYLDVETGDDDDDGFTTAVGVNLLQAIVARKPTRSGLRAGAYSWAGLGNTFWFIDAAQGVGAVIGAQILPFYDPQLVKARNEWEKLVTSTVGAEKG